MQTKKHHPIINILTFLIFFLFCIFHYVDVLNISIKNATPLILLPLLTAFSMFNSTNVSAVTGLLVGICMDSTSGGISCFNAIVLLLCAVFVSVISNNLFNKNIFSVIVLSLVVNFIYFLLKWLLLFTFGTTVQNSLTYLLGYALPSVLYTTVFIFPAYFIFKQFNKIKSV